MAACFVQKLSRDIKLVKHLDQLLKRAGTKLIYEAATTAGCESSQNCRVKSGELLIGNAAQKESCLYVAQLTPGTYPFPNNRSCVPAKLRECGQRWFSVEKRTQPRASSIPAFARLLSTLAAKSEALSPPVRKSSMESSRTAPQLASAEELPAVIPFTLDLSHRNKGLVDQLEVRYAGDAREDPELTERIISRQPEESWLEIRYPFTRSSSLREQYRLFGTGYVRFGKILEDMDAMAGDVVWRHLRRRDRLIATAAVDHLAWAGELIRLDKDLRIQGQVTWVGRSSMEITLEASTSGPEPDDTPEVLGSAHFVMVSRQKEKAAPVPQLELTTPKAKQLFEAGARNAERRKQDREESLYKKAPTGEELALLHNLFIQSHVANMPGQEWSGISAGPEPPVGTSTEAEDWTFMESTKMQSVHLMHSQQRNANGFMFGGFVMREAYELGWICARLHTRLTPVPSSVDDVAFMKPVPVGSLIQFTAQVIYVEGSLLRVLVQADELGPAAPHGGAERLHTTTNFHFAFRMVDQKMGSEQLGPFASASVESPTSAGGKSLQFPAAQHIVRKVMPQTYAEGMRYLEGYRWHTWEAQLEAPSREPVLGFDE